MSVLLQNKMAQFIRQMGNTQFIIELQKCCGYSELMLIYKEQTLSDLHKMVAYHTACKIEHILNLFILSQTGEKIIIPFDNNTTINTFIRNNIKNNTIVPVYKLPDKVVYKIIFDDGHKHLEENNLSCMDCSV